MKNKRVKPECHLWGENFSPKLLNKISDIEMRLTNEFGEVGKIGKYKDKKLPYGSCCIVTPERIKSNRVEWMADFIIKHKSEFEKAGATAMSFWIYGYGNQGNMEFSVEELTKISATKIPLCIDYVFESVE